MLISMLNYMEEQDVICRDIIENRKNILDSFIQKSIGFEKWIILATGSSLNAVNSARMYIEHILKIEVDVRIPSEFAEYTEVWDKKSVMIGVSQSGRSKSTIDSLNKAKSNGHVGPIFSMTANENSKITNAANENIMIECGEEKIGFVTKGMSATTLTLMLMGLEIAYSSSKISQEIYDNNINELQKACSLMKEALELSKQWYSNNREDILNLNRASIICFGALFGSAKEAETKLTETTRCTCIGYEMEEFIHGPNYEVNPNYYLFYIGANNPLEERLIAIKDVYLNYSQHSYYFGWNQKMKNDTKNIVFSQSLDEMIAPLVSVVPFQYLSHQLATDKGIDLTIRLHRELDEKLKRKF